MEDCIQLRGCIEGVLRDLNGRELQRIKITNTVMTVGRSFVLQQLVSNLISTAQSISYMEWGKDTTAPASTQTALGSAVTRLAIASFVTTNLTSNPPSWQAIASLATDKGNTTLSEIGLFNSSADGTMLARATMTTVDKTTSNTFTVTYTISG
jgi:hypothetical protein